MLDDPNEIVLPAHRISWPQGLAKVLWLSAPIIPAMLAQMLINFADAWMASQIGVPELHAFGLTIPMDTVADGQAGEAALAAVTPAAMACWTILSVFMGTAMVTSTFASQAVGRGEPAEAGRYAWQSIYLALATIAIAALSCLVSTPFFRVFAPNAAVLGNEVAYFNVRMWTLPIAVLVSGLSGFFIGIHRPARAAVVGIGSNLLNLVFNWFLVYGRGGLPRLGVAGSAWASVAASLLGMVVMLAFFFAPQFVRLFGTLAGWRPSLSRLVRLLQIGVPSGASWLMDMIGWTLLTIVLVQPLGEAAAAASNAAMNYLQIGFMPVVGVGTALAALVGKAIGQRRLPDARRFATCAFLVAGSYQLLIGVCLIIFREPLIRFFSHDPEVVRIGGQLLICAGIFQLFDAMGVIYTYALRGAGDTLFLLAAYMGLNFLFFVPLSLAATWWIAKPYWPAAQPVTPWVVGTLYVIVLGIVCWGRWSRGRWEMMDIFGAGRGNVE